MKKIFISYRRADTAGFAGRVYDRLAQRFGKENIFMDVDSIPPGIDFKPYIQSAIKECSLQLLVVGPRWFELTDSAGRRRIDDPHDVVRFEIESAMEHDLTIIPLYMGRGQTPSPDRLPSSVAHAFDAGWSRVDPDQHFEFDIESAILRLARTLSGELQPELLTMPTAEQLQAWNMIVLQVFAWSVVSIFVVIYYGFALLFSLHSSASPTVALWMIALCLVTLVMVSSIYFVQYRSVRWFMALVLVAFWAVGGYLTGLTVQHQITAQYQSQWVVARLEIIGAALATAFAVMLNFSMITRTANFTMRDYVDASRDMSRRRKAARLARSRARRARHK